MRFYALFLFLIIFICSNTSVPPRGPGCPTPAYQWATWGSFTGTSATGTLISGGEPVTMTMTSNFTFGSTPSIFGFGSFSNFNGVIPNTTVPETTWAAGAGGKTTMCFSQPVTNPVLLFSSLGAPGLAVNLSFSEHYIVVFDGGGMTYTSDTTITGKEGYAVIEFPGNFTCVTINSTTPEHYTNITWGINIPYFPTSINGPATGCDSVSLTAAGGVSYSWNGGLYPDSANNVFTKSGTYTVTVSDANGCQAVNLKTITVNKGGSNTTIDTAICEGQTFRGYGTTGTFVDSYPAANGCDSTITLNLTVNIKTPMTFFKSVCMGQVYEGYDKTGIYTDTFSVPGGCDSVRILNLTVNPPIQTLVNTTICQGQSLDGYTATGTYTDTLKTASGCDSIRLLNLSVLPVSASSATITICQGENWQGHRSSGFFKDTLVAANGCDSIVTTNLTVLPYQYSFIDTSICDGQSVFGYTGPGSFTDTLTASNGCDSIRNTVITVIFKPVPSLGNNNIVCLGSTLLLDPGQFDAYLWQDGSTARSYTVKSSGIYSVIVSNRCDTALASFSVTEQNCTVRFPNEFAPGGSHNNLFRALHAYNLQEYDLRIYNRYGQRVFETHEYTQGWNGIYTGKPQDSGTFVWYCTFRYPGSAGLISMKGTVVLVR